IFAQKVVGRCDAGTILDLNPGCVVETDVFSNDDLVGLSNVNTGIFGSRNLVTFNQAVSRANRKNSIFFVVFIDAARNCEIVYTRQENTISRVMFYREAI